MKKYILVLGVIATIAMTSCGSGSTSNQTTDSTSVQVDSLALSADSTTAQIPSDTTEVK